MKNKDKLIFGLIIFAIFFYLLYKIKSILTPFVIALIIAYLLDPAILKLEKYLKISRVFSVSLLTAIFATGIVIFSIFLFPLLFNQTINLFASAPQFFDSFSNVFYPKIVNFFAKINIEIEHNFVDLISKNISFIYDTDLVGKILHNIIGSTAFVVNAVSIIFICPILVFYLLKDWKIITEKIKENLPKKYFNEINELFQLIDKSLSNFIRGQTYVCFILATYYCIALAFIGLNNGILIGFLTGIFSFVPYLGYGTGLIIAIISGLSQWGIAFNPLFILIIIYILGQIIESNILVPNLIGKQINLHPIWIIFGIFFFGAVFGIIGILLSLPLTAITSVVLKYLFKNFHHLKSKN